jgi:hypothetical protein
MPHPMTSIKQVRVPERRTGVYRPVQRRHQRTLKPNAQGGREQAYSYWNGGEGFVVGVSLFPKAPQSPAQTH